MRLFHLFVCLFALAVVNASAGVIFTDNFDSTASSKWGNDFGDWSATGGLYDAGAASTLPNAHSFLPFSLTDFTVQVDVTTSGDGGIWLRAANAPATPIGVAGVLLVMIPGGGELYWHVVTDGSDYGPSLNGSSISGVPHTVRVTVTGNQYAAYLDGSATPATTLTDSTFSSGQAGLYDNSALGFDNFSLATPDSVPEPGTAALMLAGAAALIVSKRRRR
jgi:hypothetical protein